MTIKIIKTTKEHYDIWNSFVEDSNNGTLFHRLDFLGYHSNNKYNIDNLMIIEKSKIVGIFPLAYSMKSGIKIGFSPYGGSFGGLVTKTDSSLKIETIVSSLLFYLKNENYQEIKLLFPPDCYYKEFTSSIEYFFLKYSEFYLENVIITSIVDLQSSLNYNKNFLRKLKGAKNRGVTIKISQDIDLFYEILKDTMMNKHNSNLTHTLDELKLLKNILKDKMKIFLGYYDNIAISGVMTFENSSPVVLAFYNCQLLTYTNINSLSVVFDYINHYYKNKKKYVDLGTTDSAKDSLQRGLIQFKESLGARQINRYYYRVII